ncbi:unnamed protein product [Phytophthora lilii]|uniref:Unnamed protein product n=1 Tax=Phytophthora lilii TaxID=2077276 RepID=A0A9W6TL90_9STRA|nr:unnamed protein product [Phytophthora lilii]
MGVTAAARLRSTSLPQEPSRCNENRFSPSSLEDSACHACHAGVIQISPKDLPSQSARPRSESVPGKRPRKVVQVRVNLSEFVAAPPQSSAKSCIPTTSVQEPRKISECPENSTAPRLEVPSNANGRTLSQQQTLAPRVLAVRAVPKAVRRVTVAL